VNKYYGYINPILPVILTTILQNELGGGDLF
jgi:hypothetical protein